MIIHNAGNAEVRPAITERDGVRIINVRGIVNHPDDWVSILWEVPCPRFGKASGSTQCKAWQGQHEIEQLEAAGYTVLDVVRA